MTIDETRQTGRTTKQMREAAPGALFIWCSDNPQYARRLASDIGRTDLKIYGLSALSDGARQLAGMEIPELVLDHAAWLTDHQHHGYQRVLAQVRPKVGA